MKALFACLKKEAMEQKRSWRTLVLGILFVLFGFMNPAIAKLTPWLLELMSDAMAEAGMNITVSSVSALDSWAQFFKNIPMALIAFVVIQGGIFTREYRSGTMVLSLTKGLDRHKVVISKTVILMLFWSICYWVCFVITYVAGACFWDNSIVPSLLFSGVCWWLFGVWVLALMIFFSVLASSVTVVLLGTGGVVLVSYLVGMLPRVNRYLPTMLSDGVVLIYGGAEAKDCFISLAITLALTVACIAASIPIFNKKQL